MEYVLGPVLAVLISMKFTAFTNKRCAAERTKALEVHRNEVTSLITQNTSNVSQQTLKMMLPMADSVRKINNQLGL
jgi:hypothetical protein